MTNRFKGFRALFNDLFDGVVSHDVMTLSAALAFYTALSLAPLTLITLAVLGVVGVDLSDEIVGQIKDLMGAEAGGIIASIVKNAKTQPRLGTIAGVMAVITLLFSASGVFSQLQSSLNEIWKSSRPADNGAWSWVKKRLFSMGMVFTLAFLAVVSLTVNAFISLLFLRYAILWQMANNLASFTIFALIFSSLFKYLPDSKLSWKNALIGGALTSLLFTFGKSAIGIYLGQSAFGSSYGAAGSLVMMLVWVYYSAVIFFVGAELTRALTQPLSDCVQN